MVIYIRAPDKYKENVRVDAATLAHNLSNSTNSGKNKNKLGLKWFIIIVLALQTFSVLATDDSINYNSHKKLNGDDYNRYINNDLIGSHLEVNKVVFRLDDVSAARSSLPAVEEILDLFDKSGTLLDVGIIPHEMGQDSYIIPFIKPYVQKGLIGLSIHGYDHEINEFDASYSNRTEKELSDGLNASVIFIEKYFGKRPVSFSVPYDVFDEAGFNAVRDSGLKIFSSQKMSEPRPSVEPVDYLGKFDPIRGLYRLPAVISVNLWDPNSSSYDGMLPISVFTNNINIAFNDWGFAVVTIEPQSFMNDDGSVKKAQIDILGEMIKISKERSIPTTFEELYWNDLVTKIGSA